MNAGATRARAKPILPLENVRALDLRSSRATLAFAAALLYYIAAELGLALRFPDSAISAMWPPNGVLVALLLLTQRNRWWIVLAAAVPAHLVALWDANYPWWRLPWQLLHNSILAVSVCAALRWFLGDRSPFDSPRDLLAYVLIAVLACPSLAALIAPNTVLALLTPGNEPFARAWFATAHSNAIALLTLTPALYLWCLHGVEWLRTGRPLPYLEAACVALAMYLVYAQVVRGDVNHHGPLYLFLVPLVWAAIRFGVGGAATAVALGAIAWTSSGVVPHSVLILDAQQAGVLDLQIFMITTSLTALLLAVVSAGRVRSQRALQKSELRYRTIVESQSELVCRTLPDTTLTFVNDAYCRFFDRSREQLIGCKWIELLPPAGRAQVVGLLGGLARASPVLVHEHEVLLPNGDIGWMHWVNTATCDDSGRLIEIQSVGRDLTRLKRVERSLRESNERFRLVMRATHDIIYDWDIVHDAMSVSSSGEWTEAGQSPPVIKLREWTAALHADDRARYLSELERALRGGGDSWEIECRHVLNGVMKHTHERGYIVRDAGGAPARMIGSLVDISDRKRLDEANRSLAHLARLATVGEITASIAHEINQPLAAILNNSETALLLLDSKDTALAEIRSILEDIKNDDMRASNVIWKLGGLLRGEQQQHAPFDLDQIVSAASSLVVPDFRRHRTQLELHCDSRALVRGDAAHIQQVLLNLLLNALDALEDVPDARRSVQVRTRCISGGLAQVDIVDHGCGIPQQHLSTIFDSFVTTKPRGMGLGLAIARSIIRAHNGRVWAENNADGIGATFSFELTLAAAESSDASITSPGLGVDQNPNGQLTGGIRVGMRPETTM